MSAPPDDAAEPEAEGGPAPQPDAAPPPETGSDPAPEADADPAPEASADPVPEASADPAPEADPDPAPEADADPAPDAGADPAPEADAEPTPEASAEPPAPSPSEPVSPEAIRIAEALLFASDRPVQPARLQGVLPEGQVAAAVLAALKQSLEGRGVTLAEVAGGYALRTAADLAPALTRVVEVPRRLPRAAMEALAVIAWHQPVTRAEIEEIRGAGLSQATLESLLEHGLVAPKGHKEVPGRPTLWGTTTRFLEQFGLTALRDLPRREELVNAEAAAPLLAAAQSDPAAEPLAEPESDAPPDEPAP